MEDTREHWETAKIVEAVIPLHEDSDTEGSTAFIQLGYVLLEEMRKNDNEVVATWAVRAML